MQLLRSTFPLPTALLCSSLLFACSNDPAPALDAGDADAGSDAGHVLDAGMDQGTVMDAGTGHDSGEVPGAMCPTGVCNVVTNAGCGFGRCEISFGDDNPVNPPYTSCGVYGGARNLGEGSACTNTELDCAPGLGCAGPYGCVHFCCGGANDCPAGQECILDFLVMGADVGLGGCAVPAS